MKTYRFRGALRFAFVATVASLIAPATWAQDYPSKPIRILVGFSAGGSADQVARVAGAKLNAALGQSVIIDNRPGAGGNIAAEMVAKSPADGYTLLVAPSAFSVNMGLYRNPHYDAIKDFDPVTQLTSYMLFLVSHPSLPVRSVKELIALAKARPGQLNYSSSGTGTTTHIAGELLTYMAGIKMTHIPYRGTGPQLPAFLGGEVELAFGSTTVVPFVHAKRIILIGVTGAKRFPAFPDVPTIGETMPGYEVESWNAMFAPAGTPAAIVKRISEAVGAGLRQPDVLEIFDKQGLRVAAGTPEALGAMVKSEVSKWAKVIKVANIPLQ